MRKGNSHPFISADARRCCGPRKARGAPRGRFVTPPGWSERAKKKRPRADLGAPAVIARQQIRPSVVGRVVDAKSRNSSVSSVSLCPLCRTQRPTARDDVMQERSRRVCLNTEDTRSEEHTSELQSR